MFFVFAVVVVAASVFVVVAVVAAVVVDADASVVSAAFPVSAIVVVVVVVVSEAASPPKCFAALTEQTVGAGTQNFAAFVSWLYSPLSLHHQYFRRSFVSFGSGCFSFLASCFRRLYLLHHPICLWSSVSFE